MVKKFKKSTAAADSTLVGTVKESSSQIWLAGLGAFSKAQEEGSKVFEALVKEGAGLQKKFHKFAGSQVDEVTNEVTEKFTEASSKAAGAWDRLESVFEERVGRAVNRLGVPSKADVSKLAARIEELTKQVQKLSGSKTTATKTAATTVRKAVKKAVKKSVKATVKAPRQAAIKATKAVKAVAKVVKTEVETATN